MVAPTEIGHVHGDEGRGARPLNTSSEDAATHGSVRSDMGPLESQHNEEQVAAPMCASGGNAADSRGVPRPASTALATAQGKEQAQRDVLSPHANACEPAGRVSGLWGSMRPSPAARLWAT